VEAARTALLQQEKQEPTPEQIAEVCDIPAAKVRQLMQVNPEICSLDAPVGEGDAFGMLLEDAQTPEPYKELVREELSNTMDRLLGTLTERQQRVLRLHFGMEDGTCHSLEEIGTMLGISKERARQIEKQAIERAQKLGASMGLEDFLNDAD